MGTSVKELLIIDDFPAMQLVIGLSREIEEFIGGGRRVCGMRLMMDCGCTINVGKLIDIVE